MTICYFGMYASNYARNRTLIKGLRQNGVTVVECNVRAHFFWGLRYFHLLKKYLAVGKKADIIFVGFPGQTDVPLAWVLGKMYHQKVVFDAFISTYNSLVFDRKNIKADSLSAKFWWFVDWLSCILADQIILDTNEHIKYFVKTFGTKKEKFIRVFVGTDTDIFRPRKSKPHKSFVVGFHGSYLPLQGVNIIVNAAKILKNHKDIVFNLLGNGLERKKIKDLVANYGLTNAHFFDPIPYEKLPDFISSNDICLGGPFGENVKARLVIPNKVFEAMAVGVATIVGESKATRELFTQNVNCLFVNQGDSKDLAGGILKLKKDASLRKEIAKKGHSLVLSQLSPKIIAGNLLSAIKP